MFLKNFHLRQRPVSRARAMLMLHTQMISETLNFMNQKRVCHSKSSFSVYVKRKWLHVLKIERGT